MTKAQQFQQIANQINNLADQLYALDQLEAANWTFNAFCAVDRIAEREAFFERHPEIYA